MHIQVAVFINFMIVTLASGSDWFITVFAALLITSTLVLVIKKIRSINVPEMQLSNDNYKILYCS